MTRKSKHKSGKRRPEGRPREPAPAQQHSAVITQAGAPCHPAAPAPLPLTAGRFLRGLWNVCILLPLTLWPLAGYVVAMRPETIAVVRDNTVMLGYSAWVAWLAGCIAGWNLLVLRRRHEAPLISIIVLVFGLVFGGVGMGVIANDWDRQHDINRRWSTYLYTMQVSFKDFNQHGAAEVATLHARAPILYYSTHYLPFSRWASLCVDVHRGWLGGQWATAPHECAERPGQRMATWPDLMRDPPPAVVAPVVKMQQ